MLRCLGIAIALLVGSSAANANCAQYFEAQRYASQAKTELFAAYPGTAASLFACMAACTDQPSADQPGCLLMACGTACLVVGFDNCATFFSRAAAISEQESQVKVFGLRHSCTP